MSAHGRRLTVAAGLIVSLGTLPACGPVAADHTPAGNLLDADTEDLEGGLGHWEPWYSTDIARSIESARRGRASLHIAITAPDGWGVQQDNWPGFPAAPGRHRAELWARAASGRALDLAASIRWRDDAGADLQSGVVRAELDGTWRSFGEDLEAPSGTTRIAVQLTGGEGGPGDAIEVDEILIL